MVELARRARSGPRADERLFTSDLVDLVAGVLAAPVSDETRRLAAARPRVALPWQARPRMSGDAGVGADLVDLDALAAWMDDQGLGTGPITDARGPRRRHAEPAAAVHPRRHRLRAAPRPPPPAPQEQRRHAARGPGPAGPGGPGRAAPRVRRRCPDEPDTGVAGDAVFYLMAPVEGFNPSAGLPAAPRRRRRRPPRDGPRRRRCGGRPWARSTTRRSGWATSAGPTASSSARSTAGWASSTRTATSTATPARRSPGSTGWRRGSTSTGRAAGAPASCTATTTCRT